VFAGRLHAPAHEPIGDSARRHRRRASVPREFLHGTDGAEQPGVTDLVIIALTLASFAAAVGFARMCERM
jgi:hypothetical protein